MSKAHLISTEDQEALAKQGLQMLVVIDSADHKTFAEVHPIGAFDKRYPSAYAIRQRLIANAKFGDDLARRVLQAISKFNQGPKKHVVQTNARRQSRRAA